MKISVIIPVLNEARHISHTLSCLQSMRQRGHEIIVIDGGSDDHTLDIAAPLSDTVIQTGKGRALQMHAGVRQARGDVLWFLHADTICPENADNIIGNALKKNDWGRFDVVIMSQHRMLKLVSYMMNLRSCITGICTGDQGMFVKKEIYNNTSGFPAIPLMEDVALSKVLKRYGRPACVKETLQTSGRRWEEDGLIRTILLMWILRALYFIGVSPAALKSLYK